MPSRSTKDPNPIVTNWDDGYEYIRPDGPVAPEPAAASHYSSKASVAGDPRDLPRPSMGRDPSPYSRRRVPSPVSAAGTFSRPRPRRSDASPPRRSRRVSPSPTRRDRETRYPPQARQGRPDRPLARTATHPLRSERVRERPRSTAFSRSPSPVRTREAYHDGRYRDYRRADSIPGGRSSRVPRGGYSRSPSPPRYTTREQPRSRRVETYRAPSPPPTTRERDLRRPDLSRSKTTTSKARGFSGLSPRWQKAAAAAFQAGSAAAFSMRQEPGAWKGDKGIRVATAALGAGATGAFDKGGAPEKVSASRSSSKKSRQSEMEVIGGALGGLLLDQIASRAGNGKKKYY